MFRQFTDKVDPNTLIVTLAWVYGVRQVANARSNSKPDFSEEKEHLPENEKAGAKVKSIWGWLFLPPKRK